ncbi:MAG: TetR/AcrR family transcriptional regulator [Burkholderiales bacterium]
MPKPKPEPGDSIEEMQAEAARYAAPASAKEAAILAAAERLFAERGYAGTRTADIARAAGVTERTLFKYFPGKDVLLRRVVLPAMLGAALPAELARLDSLLGEDRPFADWYVAFMRDRVAAATRNPHAIRVLLGELLTSAEARARFGALWKRHLWSAMVKAIGRYQARGELRADLDAESLARMVMSLNLGYLLARTLVAPGLAWDDEKEIARLLEMIQRGAAPPD